MRESGIFDQWARELYYITQLNAAMEVSTSDVFTVNNFVPIVFLSATGILVSLFCFTFEMIFGIRIINSGKKRTNRRIVWEDKKLATNHDTNVNKPWHFSKRTTDLERKAGTVSNWHFSKQ